MPTAGHDLGKGESSGTAAPPAQVRRSAFYLQSQGQPLFAWLHVPASALRERHGVVMCPPLGYEQVHAHRSWRYLADALAAKGLLVLRFDYHGTGDSAGTDEDANRLAVWRTNIADALTWLRHKHACGPVSLLGLRLGAALALQAAADHDIDSLLLWAPVLTGRSFVREMKALVYTACHTCKPLHESPGDIEAGGFVISKQTADDLGTVDVFKIKPRCRRALIMARDDVPEDRRLRNHLLALGIQTEQTAQPGYRDMMAEPHYTKVPNEAIACAAAWFSPPAHGRNERDDEAIGPASEAAEALIPCSSAWAKPVLESVFQLGQDPTLFGILSQPACGPGKKLPVVLLVNGGSAYRVGPNRLYGYLARTLAGAGFRCVRMDLRGLGDSVPALRPGDNDTYAVTAFRDIESALKSLEVRLGARQVILMGLCSGAYFAFQSAVQLTNPALVESVLINPLTFCWKEGMALEPEARRLDDYHYYWRAAFQPRKWLKFLSGRSAIGVFGALAMVSRRWLGRYPRNALAARQALGSATPGPTHPLFDDLPGDFDRIARAGRHVACFFAKSDPGYCILNYYARRKARQLVKAKRLNLCFIEDADHTFSSRTSRRALLESISRYLADRYIQADERNGHVTLPPGLSTQASG